MRAIRGLLVGVVLVALLLVVADRVLAWVGQRAVADQVAAELTARSVDSQPPEVSFDRAPFLTQVAAGRYESITLRLRDVGTADLRLPLVELTARGVTATVDTLVSRQGEIIAERVEGSATVGYAAVIDQTGMTGLELAPDVGGNLAVRLPADLLGQDLTLTGTAEATPVDGGIVLRVDDLTVTGDTGLPPAAEPLVADLAERLSVTVPLPPLPYGLTVQSVRAGPNGFVVSVTATNVQLAR